MSVFPNAAAARKARNYVAKMTRLGLMIEYDVSLTIDHIEAPYVVVHNLECRRADLHYAKQLPINAFMAEYKYSSVFAANEGRRAFKREFRFINAMLANQDLIFDCAALTLKLIAANSHWTAVERGETGLAFVANRLRADSIVVA